MTGVFKWSSMKTPKTESPSLLAKVSYRESQVSGEEVMGFRLGPWEIGLILAIILIVFGVGKLPQVGGAIGRGLRSFRRAQAGEDDEEEEERPRRKAARKAVKGGT